MGFLDGSGLLGLGFGPDLSDMLFGGAGVSPSFKTGYSTDMLRSSLNSPTQGLLASDFNTFGGEAFGDAFAGLTPAEQNRVSGVFAKPGYMDNVGLNNQQYVQNAGTSGSQGLISQGWNTMKTEPFTNAVNTGLMGYGMYQQGQLADAAIDTMNANQRRADEAWGREKERQDKASSLRF
jgi:hypothetical protein